MPKAFLFLLDSPLLIYLQWAGLAFEIISVTLTLFTYKIFSNKKRPYIKSMFNLESYSMCLILHSKKVSSEKGIGSLDEKQQYAIIEPCI